MARKKPRAPVRARRAEREYMAALEQLGRQVGRMVAPYTLAELPQAAPSIAQMMRAYSEALTPWALRTARRMLEDVNAEGARHWNALTREMGLELRQQLRNAPMGEAVRDLLGLQVELIKSIPLDVAERVQRIALESVENASRASELAKEIMRSSEVSASRARLIARTETSRAVTSLAQVRAQAVGSPGYIWRTSEDGDVRKSHREMANKFVAWGQPPTLDNLTGHAGCLPNCRCWADAVLPE